MGCATAIRLWAAIYLAVCGIVGALFACSPLEGFRTHRPGQMQLRPKLGQGKLPDDALMFSDLHGNPASPRAISKCWEAFADKVGVGAVRFHNLRHTQASLLHTKISITLNLSTPTSSRARMIGQQQP
jgi:integrase